MASRIVRNAAALVIAAALFTGCGGDGGPDPALLAGEWAGSLGITYKGGGASSGALKLNLSQEEDFVSGDAVWSPAGEGTLSVQGPIDGTAFSLILNFRCANGDENSPTTSIDEATLITGIAAGDTVTFTGASGTACPGGGVGQEVAGASGGATRSSNGLPLETPPPATDGSPL